MIYVDASAIVALILKEEDADEIAAAFDSETPTFTSPLAIYEAVLAISRVRAAPLAVTKIEVQFLLRRLAIKIEPIDEAHADLALLAFDRFGKGRHSASLNMGDCFGYACASSQNARILFKGNDFNQTDLPSARSSP